MSIWMNMFDAFKEIVKAPFVDFSILWLLLPILIVWLVMEMYFDTHKKEQLGWNTALGNSISMFWIGVILMRHLFMKHFENFSWVKLVVVVFILLYALFAAVTAFKHSFKAKAEFLLASPTPIYYLSAVAIVWTYGSLEITIWTFIDLVILFPVIIGVERLVRHFMPESSKDEGEELGKSFDNGLETGPTGGFGTQSESNPDDLKI